MTLIEFLDEELDYLRGLWDEVNKLPSSSKQIEIKNNIAMRIAHLLKVRND